MKRMITVLLAIVILCSLTISAYAATGGGTVIHTQIDPRQPTWNLSIPAYVDIPYHQEYTEIGTVSVCDLNDPDSFGGYVDIYLSYQNLTREGDGPADQIPLTIGGSILQYDEWGNYNEYEYCDWNSGSVFDYQYFGYPYYEAHSATFSSNRTHPVRLRACIRSEDWEHARAGVYSTTLTFTTQYNSNNY